MKRYGMVIGIKPEMIDEYKRLHANPWPEILEQTAASNIRNFTIYLREPENLLFASFEYHGTDFEADMAASDANPKSIEWQILTTACQTPLASEPEGGLWSPMEEVYHVD